MAQQSSYSALNQYHLGIWYNAYRLLISTGLLLIFLLTYPELTSNYQYPQLNYYALLILIAINTVQLFALKWIRRIVQPQLIIIFFRDVCVLSLLTLASDGPNLQIGLLFVITIFSASLLLDAKKALVVTLIAVISVIYQHFIGSIFAFSSLSNFSNSALLAFLFFVVYGT